MKFARIAVGGSVVAALAGAACGQVNIFSTNPHVTFNSIPFNGGAGGYQQVFDAALFAALNAGGPVQIEEIAFSPGTNGTFNLGAVDVNLGYTAVVPGLPPGGLSPVLGNNPSGPMTTFFSSPGLVINVSGAGPEAWSQFNLVGTPFIYDPGQGNLLVEVRLTAPVNGVAVSRSAGVPQTSRAWSLASFPANADGVGLRMRFTWSPATLCYPDCDTSTGVGNLDIFDFLCFQNRYDAGSPYACDCDTSTGPGVCDIFDFLCFQNAYDAGCP